LSSDEMWGLLQKKLVPGNAICSGRNNTVIQSAVLRNNDNAKVCIKIIPVHNSNRKREDSLREGRMLAMCKSAHVLDYFGCYECRSEVALITEFCKRGDLLELVNAHGRFTEEQSRAMFKQILKGLCYMHSVCHVAHRDVKLDNLFECQDGTIKIGDFGFATSYKKDQRFTTACGTLSYVAPELLCVRDQVECKPEAADVWSAGVVLYALNVGCLPFQADKNLMLVRLIRKGEFYIPQDMSPTLRDLLSHMLALNPDERPSFAELELHKWVTAAPNHRILFESVPNKWSALCINKTTPKRGSFLDRTLLKPLNNLHIVG